jgi:hypothetical protein
MPIKRSLAVFALLTLICPSVVAETSTVRGRVDCARKGYCLIKDLALEGTINDAMTEKLIRLFDDFRRQYDEKKQPDGFSHTEIDLNSGGGSVPAAMAIGRLLRQHRMTAWIKPGAVCNSACVLIYAGAASRLGNSVGIHQPFFDVPGQQPIDAGMIKKNYASMLQEMKSYLREMNVSEQLADEMLKTPSSDIRYLTHDEQDQFGLVTIDPVEREIGNLEKAQELGIDRQEYNRREALIAKSCPLDAGFGRCYDEILKSGKVPAHNSKELPDLSQFGTPVK